MRSEVRGHTAFDIEIVRAADLLKGGELSLSTKNKR